MDDEVGVATASGVAQLFNLHELKAFAADKRVLQGTANMSVGGHEHVVPAGAIITFPANVDHDVRNLGADRCVIIFLKCSPKVLK